jgi:toxin ParE1/3/4
MTVFLLSPAARADLDEIWEYTTQQWGIERAERYIRDVVDACQAVADGRRQGRAIDDIRKGYYKLAVGSHLLFYRMAKDGTVDVVRILHQRMDIPERLR